jgi:hypothetical protein
MSVGGVYDWPDREWHASVSPSPELTVMLRFTPLADFFQGLRVAYSLYPTQDGRLVA